MKKSTKMVIAVFFGLFLFVGCIGSFVEVEDTEPVEPNIEYVTPEVEVDNPEVEQPEPEIEIEVPQSDIERMQVQIISAEYDGYFATYITGTLVADKDYEYLEIEIPCYDADGYALGTAWTNVTNIRKGDTWRFEAMILEEAATFDSNRIEITGW